MARVGITGAGGLIGTALRRALEDGGDQVVALPRRPEPAQLEGLDAVVHLAGEPVADKGWSDEQKRRIRDSRVEGTRHLVDALGQLQGRPRVLVSGSAIGYYGDRGDELLDEGSTAGGDFLAEVCVAWEEEARRAEALGMRVVCTRTGIVLARQGGALPKLALPFRFFAGGPLGNGRQWMSWIHVEDEVGLIRHALENEAVRGPVNLAAPSPVRNAVMAREVGRALGRPSLVPTPRFALQLVLGQRVEVLLASQRVQPTVAQATGYQFRYPELAPALRDLLG
jgi:uncharacterized protein (TIGR01777 family)